MLTAAATLSFCLGLAASGSAVPQTPGSRQAVPATDATSSGTNAVFDVGSVARRACGVCVHGDQLIGVGPRYGVQFDPDGVAFTPALAGPGTSPHRARRATVDGTLRFELLNAGRRSTIATVGTVGPATPVHDDAIVRYRRPGVVETYEVRPDGLEQSFVFAELPRGSGDLVVRCRIKTELPLARASATEVCFEKAGTGGVHIGAVTGLDARGAKARGALSFRNGVLEMSLPASFVERAALPIVLDPLVGAALTPGSRPPNTDIDVAYDAVSDLYLVVWNTPVAPPGPGIGPGATDRVVGQFVRRDGSLRGRLQVILPEPGSFYNYADSARVAAVRGGFVVVGIGGIQTGSFGLFAFVSSFYPTAAIGGLVDTHANPDVGGEMTGADDDAIVVFENRSRRTVQAAELERRAGTVLNVVDVGPILSHSPAISSSGGATGRHLITWTRSGDVFGAIVDRDLNTLAPPFPIAATAAVEEDPDVDGDGTNWVVAYERRASTASTDNDVACRGVSYDARTGTAYLTPAAVDVAATAGLDERDPSVAWVGDSYLVGYVAEWQAPDFDIHVRSLESFDCRECEGVFEAASSPQAEEEVRIASERSGGGGDGALIIWTREGVVEARRFRADDGLVVDLGGGCGRGGQAAASCARRGATAFGLRVQHAAPNSPSLLLLGLSRASFSCAPCTLVPNPVASVMATTDVHGNAALKATIAGAPSLLGLKLLAQWLVVSGAPASCGAGLDLSNGLEVEIQ